VQSAAPDEGRVPEALSRAQHEWRARIAAEYTSAAITHQLTLWLIQAGAPPDLIDAGLAIVGDELAHSRLSHEVYSAAGGSKAPALVRDQLGLPRTQPTLELDLVDAITRVFCLGETVAVPLFGHLRERCTVAEPRAALDRILVDEVRHREFGWDTLDWLATIVDVPAHLGPRLPAMFVELHASYGSGNQTIVEDDGAISADERAWGLAPPREYAEILARTIEKDYRPRFSARGIVIHV
jgi:hypothetical protein